MRPSADVMPCCVPLRSDLAKARAAPLRLREFRPREHYSIHRAQRRIHRLANNLALYPKRQNFLRKLQSGWRAWACSRNRNRPFVEHERARFAESRRLSIFSRGDRRSSWTSSTPRKRSSPCQEGLWMNPYTRLRRLMIRARQPLVAERARATLRHSHTLSGRFAIRWLRSLGWRWRSLRVLFRCVLGCSATGNQHQFAVRSRIQNDLVKLTLINL